MMLKKLMIALGLVAALMVTVPAAHAGNEGAYVLGGVIGGLLLGEALDNNRNAPRHGYPVYIEEPVYEKRCYTRWVKRWSEYRQTWVRKPRTQCEWVRVY